MEVLRLLVGRWDTESLLVGVGANWCIHCFVASEVDPYFIDITQRISHGWYGSSFFQQHCFTGESGVEWIGGLNSLRVLRTSGMRGFNVSYNILWQAVAGSAWGYSLVVSL